MKYFIDFEASQFAEEIISVGCVDELGRSFYSLVRPRRPQKVTGFITNLTGITRDEVLAAPSADDVFEAFYRWLDKDEAIGFYCYGDCDRRFALNTIAGITCFDAQLSLSLIIATMSDFSAELRRHFKMKRSIGLAKVVSYYRGEEVIQRHNSLDDARYLREVYLRAQNEIIDTCPFEGIAVAAGVVRSHGDVGSTGEQYRLVGQAAHGLRHLYGREPVHVVRGPAVHIPAVVLMHPGI